MKSVKHHSRLSQILALLLVIMVGFVGYSQKVDATKQTEGAKLFKGKCASCHKLKGKLVGPQLGKIGDRRSVEWLQKWIKNSGELIASGDKDAIKVFEENNKIPMPPFADLTNEQIDQIVYYTKVGDPKKKAPKVAEKPIKTAPSWLIYILALAVVVGILIILILGQTIAELKGEKGACSLIINRLKQNKLLLLLVVIFTALMTAYIMFGLLFKVGVDQGYQPIQPIEFSHKIHAGDNKIDCQYCHSAAKHSKHSGIPAVNVCMNCHKNISEVAEDTKVVLEDKILRKPELDAEIKKIYEASGWNADKLDYLNKPKKLEWVRIHNLPDFAYYNHSQHVKVAGLKCQKCHGPVETMEQVYQYSPLTMGWCIDCHKETNVDLKGNEYYAKIHKQLADKYGVEKVTIAQLGGKECGKCHY